MIIKMNKIPKFDYNLQNCTEMVDYCYNQYLRFDAMRIRQIPTGFDDEYLDKCIKHYLSRMFHFAGWIYDKECGVIKDAR